MTIDDILKRIEAYCREQDVSESTFGKKAVNDGKLVSRLRAGKSITLVTLDSVEKQLALPGSESAWDEKRSAA